MAPSPTDGEPLPNSEPPQSGRAKSVTCEFCECKLFSGGEVKDFSAKAKKLRDADEEIATLNEQLTAANSEVTRLTSELEAANKKIAETQPAPVADPPVVPPAKKGGFFSR